jgi:hypothetical protein
MSKDQVTKIAADGLRYTSKVGGSPYQVSSSGTKESCYKCGLHKPRSLGVTRKFIGQRLFKCADCVAEATK